MSPHKLFVCLVLCLCVGLSGCATPATPPSPPTATPTATPLPFAEVILTTGDFPPYVFENAANQGPMPELIKAAFAEVGIETRIDFYPWLRAEDEVRQGRAFAAFPYRPTEERKKEFAFSDPLYVYTARFFYHVPAHPGGIPYESLEDLQGYKIGGGLGFWYEPLFTEAGLDVEYVASAQQNFQKLYLDRIDLTPEEENVGWYLLRTLYPDEVDDFATLETPLVEPGSVSDLRLMVSRSYPNAAQLLEQFNAGLTAIRANGTYEQILEAYQISTEGQ